MNLFLFFALIVTVLYLVFALQNSKSVTVNFFWMRRFEAPLSVVLLITFGIGMLVGIMYSTLQFFTRS